MGLSLSGGETSSAGSRTRLSGHDGPGRLNVELMKDFRVNNIHMHCTRDFMYMDKND